MNLRQEVAKGIVWSAIQSWGSRVISFFVLLVLARLVEPEAFGLVAIASVFTAFAEVFLDQGLSEAIVQRAELEREHLDTAFWTATLTGGLLTVGGIATSGLVAGFFHEPRLAPIMGWLSLSFLFGALSSTQQAILRRRLAFKSLATRTLVAVAVGGIVSVTMAFLDFGAWSLVARSLVNGLVGTVILWQQASGWQPRFSFSKKHFKELFVFGLNTVGTKFLNFFSRRADNFLIGYFLGATALGYYTIAYDLLLTMTRLLTGVTTAVALPAFSRLQTEPERLRRAFYTTTQLTCLAAFPAFIGISVLSPELVLALYGPEWAPSIPAMQILAFIGILHSVFYFNGTVITAAGKPSWRMGIALINAISNVGAFALVVRWGIEAVAAAYVIRGYLLSPIPLLAVRKLIQINFGTYLRQYVASLIGCLAMVVVVLGLKYILSEELGLHWQLCIYTLAGAATYLLAVQLTAPSLFQQVSNLVRLVLPT